MILKRYLYIHRFKIFLRMLLYSAIFKAKIHFRFIIFLLFAFFISNCDGFSQFRNYLDPSRDPKFSFQINPLRNTYINPEFTSNIHPKFNASLNPTFTSTINPNFSNNINPFGNADLNPTFSSNLNPNYNFHIVSFSNVEMYVYMFDENVNTRSLTEDDLNLTAVVYKTENPSVKIWIDVEGNYSAYLVSNGKGGFNVFSVDGDFLEIYFVSNKQGGYNIFDLKTTSWIGFTS